MSRQASEGSTDLIKSAEAVIGHIHNNKTLFKIIKPEHWDDFYAKFQTRVTARNSEL